MASNITGYHSLLFKHAFTAFTVPLSFPGVAIARAPAAALQRRSGEGQLGANAIAVMEILTRRPALPPHTEGCWQGRRELPPNHALNERSTRIHNQAGEQKKYQQHLL